MRNTPTNMHATRDASGDTKIWLSTQQRENQRQMWGVFPCCMVRFCHVGHSEAVDRCICFTRKILHGGDWERARPQGSKNVHNFLMTVRPLSWACGHGTEMLLILKNYFCPDNSPIFSDITVQRKVPRFCTRSIQVSATGARSDYDRETKTGAAREKNVTVLNITALPLTLAFALVC